MNDIMRNVLMSMSEEKFYNLLFRDAYTTHLEELAEMAGVLETYIEDGTFEDYYHSSYDGLLGEVKVFWELPRVVQSQDGMTIEYTFASDCSNVQAYYYSDPMDFILDHSLGQLKDLPFLFTSEE